MHDQGVCGSHVDQAQVAIALDWYAAAKQLARASSEFSIVPLKPTAASIADGKSLLMFIKKDIFADAEQYLRAIFKSQGHANLLSQQRVSRARTMLTPFVLRRRKAHVLDLPPKIETVQECPMTKAQLKLYKDTLKRSRKMLEEMTDDALVGAADEEDAAQTKNGSGPGAKAKTGAAKAKQKIGVMSSGSGANVLMDLRKAASHPLLFRKKYSDAIVKKLAKELLNTPKWCDAGYDYVVEDLEVSCDFHSILRQLAGADDTGYERCRDSPLLSECRVPRDSEVCARAAGFPGRRQGYGAEEDR